MTTVLKGTQAQSAGTLEPETCAHMQSRLGGIDAQAGSMDEVAKRRELLEFLTSVPEDAENCVTTKAQEQLVEIEQQLIRLQVGAKFISPDWLYQCYSIDPKTQKCAGGSPYEDQIPRDTNEVLRTGHRLPLGRRSAAVSIAPAMGCRVKNISVSEFNWFFVKGRPPQIVRNVEGSFKLATLRPMRTPVLIASLQCDEGPRFRKAAWLLRTHQ